MPNTTRHVVGFQIARRVGAGRGQPDTAPVPTPVPHANGQEVKLTNP